MSHWYDRETGYLLPDVELKVRPGEWREATLADARKVNALVSITTFLSDIARPGLVRWQVEQGIKAALVVGDAAEEIKGGIRGWSDKELIADIYRESETYVHYTQDWGTAFHWWVNYKLKRQQGLLTTGPFPIMPMTEECAEGFLEWSKANGFEWHGTEHRFLRPDLGSAGTVDLLGTHWDEPIIADMKSQEPPLTPYDPEHPLQLSGYTEGLALPIETPRYSLIVNRLLPSDVKMHLWKDKDKTVVETNQRYDRMFNHLREFWFMSHRYDPRIIE